MLYAVFVFLLAAVPSAAALLALGVFTGVIHPCSGSPFWWMATYAVLLCAVPIGAGVAAVRGIGL